MDPISSTLLFSFATGVYNGYNLANAVTGFNTVNETRALGSIGALTAVNLANGDQALKGESFAVALVGVVAGATATVGVNMYSRLRS